MNNVLKNILSVTIFIATLISPYAYSGNFVDVLNCKKDNVCLEGMEHNQSRDDFTIFLYSKMKENYNPKLYDVFRNRTDELILNYHRALVSDDPDLSKLYNVFSSDDQDFDYFVRDNLNVVFVLHFVDSSFLITSNKYGIRSFRHEIITEDDLRDSINMFLRSRL